MFTVGDYYETEHFYYLIFDVEIGQFLVTTFRANKMSGKLDKEIVTIVGDELVTTEREWIRGNGPQFKAVTLTRCVDQEAVEFQMELLKATNASI